MSGLQIPVSTYRVQFTRDFRFVDCRDLVPYLHELGIGALYSSPRFRPRRGSSHGYDVTHPARVNSELGTDEEFDDLCEKLRHYGMGIILDVVPNHMAASHENDWWMDVLENGPSSPYAAFFDIDWRPEAVKASYLMEGKILLPVLGDLYGTVLENGEFTLQLDESGLFLRYYDRKLPIDPGTYTTLLEQFEQRISAAIGPDHSSLAELAGICAMAGEIPQRTSVEPDATARRRELAGPVKQRLFALYRDDLEVRLAMDAVLRDIGNTNGRPESADLLDRIHAAQGYRLAHWKLAFEEINYRRFFDINDLVRLRVEDPEVFRKRHEPILHLVGQGNVTGLRIDHIDGLDDPQGYLEQLQAAIGRDPEAPFYVVVEKILGRGEPLPSHWLAYGTTGYDFLNVLSDVFVHPEGLECLEKTYRAFSNEHRPFAEICYARNKQVMWKLFSGEVHALGHVLGELAAQDRHARDVPLSELVNAMVEVTACLPVYRTYIRDFTIDPRDRRYIERTLDFARERAPANEVSSAAFDFLRRVLLLEPPPYAGGGKAEWLGFVMRWQRFSGPVMAKGLEDTAFYVHNSLISRNEVGGDPLRECPPHSLREFHAFLDRRRRKWPYSFNATATHDTKRGEDMRARINVLSELPREWEKRLLQWSRWNRAARRQVNGHETPTPSEESLIYQTLLGAWPLDAHEIDSFIERLKGCLIKSAREAKTHTGWLHANQAHEDALIQFACEILKPGENNRFLPDFLRFQRRISFHGALNSLSQVLIKITAPGVPDFYQGTDLWDFSLVDPDNRRPVDHARRIAMLEDLRRRETENLRKLLKDMVSGWKDAGIKLYLTDKALDFRRAHAPVYLEGDYLPLEAIGPRQENVVAFARCNGASWALTVAPRWSTKLVRPQRAPLGEHVWTGTAIRLPEGAPSAWRDVLTHEAVQGQRGDDGAITVPVAKILSRFPVALLKNES